MANNIYSFIGIVRKANKLLSGEETCERAIRSNKVKLLIIACDSSENTRQKFEQMCRYRDVDIKYFGEKVELGGCLGKEVRSVIAILDDGFAKRLVELIDEY